jgi:low temperature requirement protein LtrA
MSLVQRLRARPTGEDHATTTFELFFDLVYVFAITQLTVYVHHAHSVHGLIQGLLMLGLLWWTWSAYTWLGNQARADEGTVRVAMVIALAAIFVVAMTIPEVWHDGPGGLNGPLVFVLAYLVIRAVHLLVYVVAAAGDRALLRTIALSWLPLLADVVLLLIGILLGGWLQTVLFALALGGDVALTWVFAQHGNWRIHSASHWTERHGLFVILALGESVVAVGAGAAQQSISAALLVGAVLGVMLSLLLWWVYFDLMSPAAERVMRDARGQHRVRLAIDAYTYGHYPVVAGIVVTAVGVEEVLAHAVESEAMGVFAAGALFGGVALYLVGQLIFKWRLRMGISIPRAAAVVVLMAAWPIAAFGPALLGLAVTVVLLTVLIAFETTRYAEDRAVIREA